MSASTIWRINSSEEWEHGIKEFGSERRRRSRRKISRKEQIIARIISNNARREERMMNIRRKRSYIRRNLWYDCDPMHEMKWRSAGSWKQNHFSDDMKGDMMKSFVSIEMDERGERELQRSEESVRRSEIDATWCHSDSIRKNQMRIQTFDESINQIANQSELQNLMNLIRNERIKLCCF